MFLPAFRYTSVHLIVFSNGFHPSIRIQYMIWKCQQTTWAAKLSHQALVSPGIIQNFQGLVCLCPLLKCFRLVFKIGSKSYLIKLSLLFMLSALNIQQRQACLKTHYQTWKKPKKKWHKSDMVCHFISHTRYHTITYAFLKSFIFIHPHKHLKMAFELWEVFLKSSALGDCIHWIRVDGKAIQREKCVLWNENRYVWMEPYYNSTEFNSEF